MHIPYTYLIGWSNYNIWYYGVRYAKKCNPKDLWVTYFTSSKYVKEFRNAYGEPNVIQIRKQFDNVTCATNWEEKVIRRMKCVLSKAWLNKGNAKKEFYNISKPTNSFEKGNVPWCYGKKLSYKVWNKGKKNVQKFTEERNKKLSNSLKRTYEITKPDGEVEVILGLKDYCLKNNWNYGKASSKVRSSKTNTYKGHKIIRIDERRSGHTQ